MAVGEGPEDGLLGEPTWAGAINRDSGNRQRSKADAPSSHGCCRQATFPQGLPAGVRAGDYRKATAGVACDRHTVPGAAAGVDYSRFESRPGALRTTVKQNLICAPGAGRIFLAIRIVFVQMRTMLLARGYS